MDPTTAGNTAWVLTAVVAVVLMLPGLVLFYGGMVSRRTTTNMMMMVFGSFALTAFLWVGYGFSAVFGDSLGGAGLLGNPLEFAGLGQLLTPAEDAAIPPLARRDPPRVRRADDRHRRGRRGRPDEVRGLDGVRRSLGDALLPARGPLGLRLRRRRRQHDRRLAGQRGRRGRLRRVHPDPRQLRRRGPRPGDRARQAPHRPVQPKAHNLPFVVVGVGLLLTGWLGFDGSALGAADNDVAVALFNTLAAACAGTCAWLVVEKLRDGHPSTLGACSGAIAALVAITPSCGVVSPVGSMVIGVAAAVVCYFAVLLKHRFGYDDALDVVALHLVGGVVGALAIGFLAHPDAPIGEAGLLYGGGAGLLGRQAVALLATCAWTFTLTYLIAKVLDRTIGIRVTAEQEVEGLDRALHAENAYEDPDTLAQQPRGHAEPAPVAEARTPAADPA